LSSGFVFAGDKNGALCDNDVVSLRHGSAMGMEEV
jgi:hypothetical protein